MAEEKEKKKKRKPSKKKKKFYIILLLIGFMVLGILSYFGYDWYEKNTLQALKKINTENVVTKKTAKLYNEKKKVVGTLEKGFTLSLKKVKSPTTKNRYLKIKDSNYYIYYKDIKKASKEKEKENSYYLPLQKEIETKKDVTLYDGKKEMVNIKQSIQASVEKKDEKNYYISFLGKTLRIEKKEVAKEKEAKEEIKGKANHVSVIFYDKIKNDCGEDTTCLKPASVKAHIKRLQKEGYYFLTKEDFLNYIKGNINVKEKAIFMAINEESEEAKKVTEETKVPLEKIEEKDGYQLMVTNKTATPNEKEKTINCYQAKSYTIIDNYVRMANGEEVADNGKETPNDQRIAVINYHFFYDGTFDTSCNETICLEKAKFQEQLQWLKDNGYKTLTIEEFADWMDGIIELPQNSVLLTVDDGGHGTGTQNGNILIPLLEEYKMHATLFLITGWDWKISDYQSPYLDIQSHSYNLHYEASCPDGRGLVACSDYQTVKTDLQKSLDIIRDNTSFCFPFYSYDRESLQAVQELGFRVAFIGGSVKARRTDNHYLIPRFPIVDDITLNEFIWMVS